MDQDKAKILADEGFELIETERYDEAESKYLEALKLIDPNHWSTQDIHGQFGMLLNKMGKTDEALEQYNLSLQSALRCDSPESVSVTLARYFLANFYMSQERYGEAIIAVRPSLEIECENKWLACFVAAQIHYKLGDEKSSDYYASQVLFLAPKGKYSSLSELKKIIRE
jgi:tetratricopeptide (TPR) repeat protein